MILLITALKKIGFGETFVKWIQILLRNRESCIVNGGTTLKYFKLEKGTRQGDPISAYLFILILEIAFTFIKKIKILRLLIFFTRYSYILLMPMIQNFF